MRGAQINNQIPYPSGNTSHTPLFRFLAKRSIDLSKMSKQKRASVDNITGLEPATAEAGPPPKPPCSEQTIEPLDSSEDPLVRTKLRIYVILLALYVRSLGIASASTSRLTIPLLARPLYLGPGPDHCRNIYTYNFRRFALRFRLYMDRRCVLARQRRNRSDVG